MWEYVWAMGGGMPAFPNSMPATNISHHGGDRCFIILEECKIMFMQFWLFVMHGGSQLVK